MPTFLEHDANSDKSSNRGLSGDYLDLKHDILNKTYNIEIEKLNLNVEIHSKNAFSETEKNEIKDHIHNAVNEFIDYIYCFSVNLPLSKAEIYLVDNIDEYNQYCDQYGLSGKHTKGFTYVGNQVTPSRIYLYKEGNSIVGLKHELSYVLQDHVTEHKLANVVNNHLILNVISDAIADFCEYDDSILDQMCAERRVFDKIYRSDEFSKYSDKSICDVLEELKDSYIDKDTDPTIRDFGFTLLNFFKKIIGKDFCTLLFDVIKQGDVNSGETLCDLIRPINAVEFKQFLQEDLNRLESMYKYQYDIPQDVVLQYVTNDDFSGNVKADTSLQIVQHKHFEDIVPTIKNNVLPDVINNSGLKYEDLGLEYKNVYDVLNSTENHFSVGLSGPTDTYSIGRKDYLGKKVYGSYDTPAIIPMNDDPSSGSYKKCLASDSKELNEQKFKSDVCDNVHNIRNDYLKLNLKVYALHELSYKRLYEIEKGLSDTIEKFKNNFRLEPNDKETTFELYFFDNKDQYEYYGDLYNLGICGSGGKAFFGNYSSPYKIYVYGQGDILNLKHELTHALEGYARGHNMDMVGVNDRIFTEGLAEYVQDDDTFLLKGIRNKEKTSSVLYGQYDDMDSAVNKAVKNTPDLKYSVGHAFVTFLQEKHPGAVTEYFKACKAGDFNRAEKIINIDKYSDFIPWVESKDMSLYLEDMNMLKVELGDKLLSYDNAQVSAMPWQHYEYYSQKICNMQGETIGEISPVVNYGLKNVIRSWNTTSNNMIEIANPEYHFLKLVTDYSGKNAYVYCNKDGEEFFYNKDYINYAFNILRKYNSELAAMSDILQGGRRYYGSDLDKYFAKIPNSDLLLDSYLDSINESMSKESLLSNPRKSSIIKRYAMEYGLAALKEEQVYKALNGSPDIDPEVSSIIRSLTYVTLDNVIGVNGFDIKSVTSNPNTILHAVMLGKGDDSSISLYLDNNKVGEVLSESGYCRKDINTGQVTFLFQDILKMISSTYLDKMYMVISEQDGVLTTTLVDDIQRAVSGNIIWGNKFSHPSVSHFYPDYEKYLLRNASVQNDHHIINEEKSVTNPIIVAGELLDDKGTVRTDDDVYRAVVKHGDDILHQFKSMSFYITEPFADAQESYGSNFFIRDEGRNLRFEFPKEISHLKLVNVNGSKKLVPCTASGDEHPNYMPNIPDEYRYIDPIFAHRFEIPCHSNKSLSIGLVDFDQYKEGSLFKLQYYNKDYRIHRDEHGNEIKLNGMPYTTKVDLLYDGKVIGMLSDTVNQFQGDIFISVSRNYSHNDFLASKNFQRVDIRELGDGIYSGTYQPDAENSIGNDIGYSEQAVFYFKDNDSTDVSMSHDPTNVSTILPYQNEL